ncbi:hypothetical protein ACFQV2_19265 [Actinokineospora soli]|uniref:Uncharacterized protein n=1 Tax=Actinokineospora soli TaxID=1048753 RepID=A0ABW2TPM3_9PSEU
MRTFHRSPRTSTGPSGPSRTSACLPPWSGRDTTHHARSPWRATHDGVAVARATSAAAMGDSHDPWAAIWTTR